jgi:hypothetical protein
LGAHSRRERGRRPGAAEAGGGGRWRRLLRRVAARPEQQAASGATAGPRGGPGLVGWHGIHTENRARGGGDGGHGGSLDARARGGVWPFVGDLVRRFTSPARPSHCMGAEWRQSRRQGGDVREAEDQWCEAARPSDACGCGTWHRQGSHKRHEQQLGCGAQTSGHWPASACMYGGVAQGRHSVPARCRARSHSWGKNVSY